MRLIDYVDDLESKGQCWFLKSKALIAMDGNKVALDEAIKRLQRKRRIITIKTGFLVIIPTTYKNQGIIPADWFVKPLMEYLNIPYYMGLLTAASFYGAAHQKPQIFQVITNQDLSTITKNRLRICFYEQNKIAAIPTKDLQVRTGYIKASTPEATAMDLIKYHRVCGYLSNVATVLSELHEVIDPEQLYNLATSNTYDLACLQRLGYLLSLPEVEGAHVVDKIKNLIQNNKPRFVPLQPGQAITKTAKDNTWRIFVNEEIEVDI